jgi:hypothetical protein
MPVYCCVYTIRRPSSITPRLFIYIFLNIRIVPQPSPVFYPVYRSAKFSLSSFQYSILSQLFCSWPQHSGWERLGPRRNTYLFRYRFMLFYYSYSYEGSFPCPSRPACLLRLPKLKKIVSPIPGHMIKHPRSSSHHVPGDRALKLRNKRCVKRSICSRRRHSTCLFTNQHLLPLPRTTHRQLPTLTLDITATAG